MSDDLRAIARLLDYPTAELIENLDAVAAALAGSRIPAARRAAIQPLLDRLAARICSICRPCMSIPSTGAGALR